VEPGGVFVSWIWEVFWRVLEVFIEGSRKVVRGIICVSGVS